MGFFTEKYNFATEPNFSSTARVLHVARISTISSIH